MFKVKLVSPWVKEFKPPSKCPICKRVNSLVYLGKRTQWGDHVYHCEFCGSLVGAPTGYAECNLMDIPLEKDVFFTPCVRCPQRKIDEHHGVCVHWKNLEYPDLSIAEEIERSMRRYKPFESRSNN